MLLDRPLSDQQLLLLMTRSDTEDAPWITTPDVQWRIIALLMSILRLHVRRQTLPWYLAAEMRVTMPRIPGNPESEALDLGPDLMMAVSEDLERDSWSLADEGQPPLLVVEVVTRQSRHRDFVTKPSLYDAMGVREYVIFAPRRWRGGSRRPVLSGYHRDDTGAWVPWQMDKQGTLWSEALDLALYVEDGKWLRVRDRDGRVLPSSEEEAARAEQEARRAEQEGWRAEQEARRAEKAEAEVARLRALLEQQRQQQQE